MKLSPRDLNSSLYLPHFTSTYICDMTIILKMYDDRKDTRYAIFNSFRAYGEYPMIWIYIYIHTHGWTRHMEHKNEMIYFGYIFF